METCNSIPNEQNGICVPSLPKRNGNSKRFWFRKDTGEFPAYLRGMETVRRYEGFRASQSFPAYLRGMETSKLKGFGAKFLKFPAYLRGMETQHRFIDTHNFTSFPAYLRGMETHLQVRALEGFRVPSLPKRNGNFSGWNRQRAERESSQPT